MLPLQIATFRQVRNQSCKVVKPWEVNGVDVKIKSGYISNRRK